VAQHVLLIEDEPNIAEAILHPDARRLAGQSSAAEGQAGRGLCGWTVPIW
jgi:hypothetical protein